MPAPQGKWFLLTVPSADWESSVLPPGLLYLRGQKELSASGYEHWQLCGCSDRKRTVTWVRRLFGGRAHVELSRSSAARDYVWKEDTYVDGTRFELGVMPVRAQKKPDWEQVWLSAKTGDLDSIPANIRVCHYSALRKIQGDFGLTTPMERSCDVFWGPTGTGKSRRAWAEAGMESYSKDPRTKFWDGYRGEKHVVLDEFRGSIDIAHLLRWLDRYPVRVEIKGSSVPLCAERIWITSNLAPEEWFPMVDAVTFAALRRRLNITRFH